MASLVQPGSAWSQTAPAKSDDIPLIATVRSNGLPRGEVTLLRKSDGDFWIAEGDLPKLGLQPHPEARRLADGEPYYSLRALGATALAFSEKELELAVDFPAVRLQSNVLNLSPMPPKVEVSEPGRSLILSYRLTTRVAQPMPERPATLATDLNMRFGPLLLRQETRLDFGRGQERFIRGMTQAIRDDLRTGTRWIAGDMVSSAGAFGSSITAAGIGVQRVFELTPDVIRQPTASMQASTMLPAEVQVDVDGSPYYRGNVGPGPINIDNLLLFGGSRNVRVTVVDASGRREVFERQYFFSDAVLAPGLQEFSYFAGRRSFLDQDNRWRYLEPAWQGYHRVGVTDALTIGAGGEGNGDFTTTGAGVSLRSDMLGAASMELLANRRHGLPNPAWGRSLRYTYTTPTLGLALGWRSYDDGFRTFNTTDLAPFLRSEWRASLSGRVGLASVTGEVLRSTDALGTRTGRVLRVLSSLGKNVLGTFELQFNHEHDGRSSRVANFYLRWQLDPERWVGSTLRSQGQSTLVDIETGKLLSQGEGIGYRVGATTSVAQDPALAYGYGSLNWNLRPASVDVFATAPLRAGGPQYAEASISGSVVGVDGSWGMARQVNDSFVLARLGVPQPGVDVLLNNQVQGKTDAEGKLFIPQVSALGRQDISVEDRQMALQYTLQSRRRTIVPAFRSGTVVEFGGKKVSAIAGPAWLVSNGQRRPIAARSFSLTGPQGTLKVETGNAGDFYIDDAAPGRYAGRLDLGAGKSAECHLVVPTFDEAVHELEEGIVCE